MGTVVVDVMPKAENVDPQAHPAAFGPFVEIRAGKRFALTVSGEVGERELEAARVGAAQHLIDAATEEIVSVRVAGDATDLDDDVTDAWDDMPEHWGADAPIPAGAGEHDPKGLLRHPQVSEEHLRHVEAGSYYGRADDVRAEESSRKD